MLFVVAQRQRPVLAGGETGLACDISIPENITHALRSYSNCQVSTQKTCRQTLGRVSGSAHAAHVLGNNFLHP